MSNINVKLTCNVTLSVTAKLFNINPALASLRNFKRRPKLLRLMINWSIHKSKRTLTLTQFGNVIFHRYFKINVYKICILRRKKLLKHNDK